MDKINLRYPVVLVHGIVAHDRKSVIDFWGRIPQVLRDRGIAVFFGNTDSWGDYETNALALKKTIETIRKETGCAKVNLIAHSKGGLDSRYLSWKHDYGDFVASLTTIATPHRGAEIAGLINKQKIVHSLLAKKALNAFGKIYGDTAPNLYNVNSQLTPEYMETFNQNVVPDARVFYQSLYTAMRHPLDDWLFFYTWLYVRLKGGKNDGIVTQNSARWGENCFEIAGGISHGEILDLKKKRISKTDIPGLYAEIVKGLAERGY